MRLVGVALVILRARDRVAQTGNALPTTLVLRFISAFRRYSGWCRPVRSREHHDGPHVVLGLVRQDAELGELGAQPVGSTLRH